MSLPEREGLMSVWLDISFDEDNDLFGWFDHDYSEGGGLPSHRAPLRDVLHGFSYWESWIDQAVAAGERLSITSASYAWMIFDHVYEGEPGPLPGYDQGVFLGVFTYQKD